MLISPYDLLTVVSDRYMPCCGGLACLIIGILMLPLLRVVYRCSVRPARPEVYVLWKRDGGWGEERPLDEPNKEE